MFPIMNGIPHSPDGSAAAGSTTDPVTGPLTESTRVEAFSDGVFAIAITLLVLDLKAPVIRGAVLHDLLRRHLSAIAAGWPAS